MVAAEMGGSAVAASLKNSRDPCGFVSAALGCMRALTMRCPGFRMKRLALSASWDL